MEALVAVLLKELVPAAVEMVKGHHASINPDLPALTDEEALQILLQAVNSSVAKDDQWLQAHKS